MVGFVVTCHLSLLLYVEQLRRYIEYDWVGDCGFIEEEVTIVSTLGPGYIYADCTQAFGALDVQRPTEGWFSKEDCNYE